MATRVTLSEAVRRLIDEEDEDNSHFTSDEIYDYLNQAIRYLGTEIEWPLQLAQATPVTDQAVYELPDDFVSLSDVYYDNRDLLIIDRTDLPALRSDWQNAPSGLPIYAYRSDNAKVGLFPKPSSSYTANSEVIQIQYIKVPADLDDDTDTPDLHIAFNDCLPFYAAFLCEHKLGNSKRSEVNFNLYEVHKKRLLSKVQKFSPDALRFRWSAR